MRRSPDERDPCFYQETHPDDLRQFGLIPEFIGRFPMLVGLQDLDEAALVRILTEPRNALVRQYQQLFLFEGVQLEISDAALIAIARKAIARGTGARGLRSVLEGLLQRPMFELPSMSGVVGCQIDAAAVKGTGPILWEYAATGAAPAPMAQPATAGEP